MPVLTVSKVIVRWKAQWRLPMRFRSERIWCRLGDCSFPSRTKFSVKRPLLVFFEWQTKLNLTRKKFSGCSKWNSRNDILLKNIQKMFFFVDLLLGRKSAKLFYCVLNKTKLANKSIIPQYEEFLKIFFFSYMIYLDNLKFPLFPSTVQL